MRVAAFLMALAFGSIGATSAAVAAEGGADEPEARHETAEAGVGQSARKSERNSRGKRRKARKNPVQGHVVAAAKLRDAEKNPLPVPSGDLHLRNLNSDEELKMNIFAEDGTVSREATSAAQYLFRCRRTDTEKAIDPRILEVLSRVHDHFGGKPIEIVSAYRNQRRETSYHFKGSAIDIRIEGVSPKTIKNFLESIDTGGMGIGYYPRAKFVHVDVRPLPSYRWIDRSPPTPNSPDKRPPRGFKRKKLQS